MQAELRLHASASITNTSGILIAPKLHVQTHDFHNEHGTVHQLSHDGTTILNVIGTLHNRHGHIAINSQDAQLTTTTFNHPAGTLTHAGVGNFTLTAATLDSSTGIITSNGTLRFIGEQVTLDGGKLFAQHWSFKTKRFSNQGGTLLQTGSATASNHIEAQTVNNTGGTIATQGALSVQTETLHNSQGTLIGASTATVQAHHVDNTQGTLASQGNVNLTAQTVDNTKGMVQADTLTAKVSQSFSNQAGNLTAQHLHLQAQNFHNQNGTVQQLGHEGTSALHITGTLNNTQGNLSWNSQHATLTAHTFLNQRGTLGHAGAGLLTMQANTVDSEHGTLASNGALSFPLRRLVATGIIRVNIVLAPEPRDALFYAFGVACALRARFLRRLYKRNTNDGRE